VTGLAAGQSTTFNVSYANAAGTRSASWTGAANDPPPPAITGVSNGSAAAIGSHIIVHLNNGYTGTLCVWADGTYADGTWGSWAENRCYNASFTNGVGETDFYGDDNYRGKALRIRITGYQTWTGSIW